MLLTFTTFRCSLPGMKLSEYFSRHDIDPAGFAGEIGVTREALRLWLAGERTPRPKLMAKIKTATRGAVTSSDFELPESQATEAAE